MPSTDDLTVATALEERDVYRIVRIALIVAGGLVLIGLLSVLPGLDALLGGLSMTASALLIAGATYLATAGLLAVASPIRSLVRRSLEGPQQVVDDAAASVSYLVVFLAVVVAYRGFAPTLEPAVAGLVAGWTYHFAFLLVGLVPVALIARRLHRSLDPVADLLTRWIVDAAGTSRERSDLESTEN